MIGGNSLVVVDRRLFDKPRDREEAVARPVKRIDAVMNIFERVRQRVPARLLLVGDGPELATAYKLARDFGIANLVLCVALLWAMFVVGRPDYAPVVGRAEGIAAQAVATIRLEVGR